jgi:hypothetical protein
MGTRSIITFKSEEGILQVYKHWDGYPESTVPELQEFLKWNGHRNEQLDYTMANYCYWHKDKHFKEQVESYKDRDRSSERDMKSFLEGHDTCRHTGLGVCYEKPIMNLKQASDERWAEYFYIVDLDQERIYEEATSQYWSFTNKTPKKYMGYKVEEYLHN